MESDVCGRVEQVARSVIIENCLVLLNIEVNCGSLGGVQEEKVLVINCVFYGLVVVVAIKVAVDYQNLHYDLILVDKVSYFLLAFADHRAVLGFVGVIVALQDINLDELCDGGIQIAHHCGILFLQTSE